MSIQEEIQLLAVGALVELFELDASVLGGSVYYFHEGTNQLKSAVVWQGVTYNAMAIQVTGFEYSGQGKLPRPNLKAQNVDGIVGALCDTYDDLIGAKVTRKRTFAKYLDAVNFPGGVNPTEDDTAAFPDDVYYINQKTSQTKFAVEFELACSFDIHGVLLPRRQIIQHTCIWVYRSAECSYAGGPAATVNDIPTGLLAEDACSKSVNGCKLRFGATAILPFGGFPGVGVIG